MVTTVTRRCQLPRIRAREPVGVETRVNGRSLVVVRPEGAPRRRRPRTAARKSAAVSRGRDTQSARLARSTMSGTRAGSRPFQPMNAGSLRRLANASNAAWVDLDEVGAARENRRPFSRRSSAESIA